MISITTNQLSSSSSVPTIFFVLGFCSILLKFAAQEKLYVKAMKRFIKDFISSTWFLFSVFYFC